MPLVIGDGTPIGDMAQAGGLAAAFNFNSNQAAAACAVSNSDDLGWVGKTLVSPKRFAKAVIHGSNDTGYVEVIAGAEMTITIRGKQGAAPLNETQGTAIGSITFTDGANESAGRTITSTDTTTLWDHLFAVIANNASDGERVLCGELVFFAVGETGFAGFFD